MIRALREGIRKNAAKTLVSAALLFATHKTLTWIDPAVYYHLSPLTRTEERVSICDYSTADSFTNPVISMTHKHLEERLGCTLKGRYTDEFAGDLLDWKSFLDESHPGLRAQLKAIEVVPRQFKTDYEGLCFSNGTIALKHNATYATYVHELAHVHARHVPDAFWDAWIPLSGAHYKTTRTNGLMRLHDKIFGDARADDREFPKKGILRAYGRTNADEDVATFVEDCIVGMRSLERVDPLERDVYENKLGLLAQYGFITPKLHGDAREALSSDHPATYRRILARAASQLIPPTPLRLSNNGGALVYRSSDGAVDIWRSHHEGADRLSVNVRSGKWAITKTFDFTWRDGVFRMYSDALNPSLTKDWRKAMPVEFLNALHLQGYDRAENTSYSPIGIELGSAAMLKPCEQVARKSKISPSEIMGPMPYTGFYGDELGYAYCVRAGR